MSDTDVVNIRKSPYCALCCSNFCYCTKESLMRQVRMMLDAIKDRNAQIELLETQAKRGTDGEGRG